MSGTIAHPEGITNPPIDDLLQAAEGSKYGLVIYAAKRARQINAYYSLLSEGQLENVGPLVETHVQEKPLSVALREIDAGLLTVEPWDPSTPVETEFSGGEYAAGYAEGFDGGFGAAPGGAPDDVVFGAGYPAADDDGQGSGTSLT